MKKVSVVIVFISLLIISCSETSKKTFLSPDSKTYTYKFKPLADTILPPEIVELTASNAPQSFIIKPKTIPLKYPSGIGSFSVKQYGAADGLSANTVQDLAIDHQGNIWVGGLGSLSKFDGTSFTNFSQSNGVLNMFITQLLVDSDGMLWLGNFDKTGLYRYDGKLFKPIPLDLVSNAAITYLMESPEGDIWAGTTNGLYRAQGDSVTRYGVEDGLPDDYIIGLLPWPDQGILIFTPKGNRLFTRGHFEPFTEIPTLPFYRPALKDGKRNIWFLTQSEGKFRLGKYDGKSAVYFNEDQDLSDSGKINGIIDDQKGNIWVTAQNAIFLLQDGKFKRYPINELGLPGRVQHIIEDQTGNLWIGSMEGLFKANNGLAAKIEIVEDRQAFGVTMRVGKNSVKWAITNQTLVRYDQTTAQAYDLSGISENISWNFYAGKNGHVWLTTDGARKKLIKFDGEKFLLFTNSKDYINLDRIQSISEDATGNLVLTGIGGLTLFDGKQFVHYGQRQGFPNYVHKYFQDSKQRKWVGTDNNGAWVFWGDSVLHFNTENGLKNNFVGDLAEDPFGNIWMATCKHPRFSTIQK